MNNSQLSNFSFFNHRDSNFVIVFWTVVSLKFRVIIMKPAAAVFDLTVVLVNFWFINNPVCN